METIQAHTIEQEVPEAMRLGSRAAQMSILRGQATQLLLEHCIDTTSDPRDELAIAIDLGLLTQDTL